MSSYNITTRSKGQLQPTDDNLPRCALYTHSNRPPSTLSRASSSKSNKTMVKRQLLELQLRQADENARLNAEITEAAEKLKRKVICDELVRLEEDLEKEQ